MSFRIRRILYMGGSTHEDKGGPVIGMWVVLPYLDHGLPQSLSVVLSAEQATVECFHEFCGTAVVYIPQSQKQALRARRKQTSCQTDELVPRSDHVQTG